MQAPRLWPPFLLLLTSLFPTLPLPAQQAGLRLEVLNVEQRKGKVVVELYTDKASWLKTPFRKVTLPTNKSAQTISLAVPPGTYAVSIYQDTNENGSLDQNFLGIPTEPIGFGNNYRPLGKPKFESAVIEYTPAAQPVAIKLFTVF
jgi:uncharacterized protein (DUF2141 family)